MSGFLSAAMTAASCEAGCSMPSQPCSAGVGGLSPAGRQRPAWMSETVGSEKRAARAVRRALSSADGAVSCACAAAAVTVHAASRALLPVSLLVGAGPAGTRMPGAETARAAGAHVAPMGAGLGDALRERPCGALLRAVAHMRVGRDSCGPVGADAVAASVPLGGGGGRHVWRHLV